MTPNTSIKNGKDTMQIKSQRTRLAGDVTAFNVAGTFCATQAKCTYKQGPLNEGTLDGLTVTCPWHGSQFNVCTGAVMRGPAADPLKTLHVIVEGEIGRVEYV